MKGYFCSLSQLHFLDLIQHIIDIAFLPGLPYNWMFRSDVVSPDKKCREIMSTSCSHEVGRSRLILSQKAECLS